MMNSKDNDITVSVEVAFNEEMEQSVSIYISSPTLDVAHLPLLEARRINKLLTKVLETTNKTL